MAQPEQRVIQVIQARVAIQVQTGLLVTVVRVVLEEPVVTVALEDKARYLAAAGPAVRVALLGVDLVMLARLAMDHFQLSVVLVAAAVAARVFRAVVVAVVAKAVVRVVVRDHFQIGPVPAVAVAAVVLVQLVTLAIQALQVQLVLAVFPVTQEQALQQVVQVELLHSHGLEESDLQAILAQ